MKEVKTMGWIFGGAAIALSCYMVGYVMGCKVTMSKFASTREEMGLDETCYGCDEAGLPCDPKCKLKEENKDEQSEENNNQED